MGFSRKVPTLVDLCTQTAIANIRYIGDVGEVDLHLLKDILTHCNIDQLTHIENSTKVSKFVLGFLFILASAIHSQICCDNREETSVLQQMICGKDFMSYNLEWRVQIP